MHTGSLFSTSSPTFVISSVFVFKIIVILTSVSGYFILVLMCIFLMINDGKHLLMDLMAICVSLGKNEYSAHFLIGFFFLFAVELYEFLIYFV